jgi:hypothetical protein
MANDTWNPNIDDTRTVIDVIGQIIRFMLTKNIHSLLTVKHTQHLLFMHIIKHENSIVQTNLVFWNTRA